MAGSDVSHTPAAPRPSRAALARVFLKLGTLGFGGPAAHIAMMEEEVVARRHWLDRAHFLDLVGVTNLIPGPNSTEMAIHVGYSTAGLAGLLVAGACFIAPAVALTGAAAWAYVAYGTLPALEPLLGGIKPAILAVIAGAVWRLGRTAITKRRLVAIGLAVAAAALAGANEVLALLGGGVLGMVWLRAAAHPRPPQPPAPPSSGLPLALPPLVGVPLAAGASGMGGVPLWALGAVFLKVGAVLYGSGYVLVALLEDELVRGRGWLTHAQLLDAIAIGQLTPGPVLTTATFVGYTVAGVGGAAVATAAIFLPSFVFVAAVNPIVPRLRRSAWMGAFLDAVNVSAVGLMCAVLMQLGAAVLVGWRAWVVALGAGALGLRFGVAAPWLVLGGAMAGWLLGLV